MVKGMCRTLRVTAPLHAECDRYSYVDVPFQLALQSEFDKGLNRVLFKYDINCKYNLNAYRRCVDNPHSPLDPKYRERLKKTEGFVEYDVNDFHIKSHLPSCSDEYGSFHRPLMGIRACEEVESTWAIINRFQWATREMDAGARQDQLTSVMLRINEDKTNKMGA
jgi:hypothetical protein